MNQKKRERKERLVKRLQIERDLAKSRDVDSTPGRTVGRSAERIGGIRMSGEPHTVEIRAAASDTERIKSEGPLLELGQWYWVLDWRKWDRNEEDSWGATQEEYEAFLRKEQGREEAAKKKKPKSIKQSRMRSRRKREVVEEYKWLGCLMNIGSNFVELKSPHGGEIRVHMDEFDERLSLESDSRTHIGHKVADYQQEVRDTLEKIRALTARLGIVERQGIEHGPDTTTRALAAASGQKEIKEYEGSLVRAKEKDLPALFENVETATKEMTIWMKAETLPMQAQVGDLNSVIKVVDNRIFDVSLYAGLIENITEIRGGEPAAYDEKVHMFQRRLYMDEECLANYRVGGMEFKNVKAFGRWLCRPKNLNRVFPFPRCMVSFQVRRNDKLRRGDGTYKTAHINFNLKQDDEATFWYIRNGERMYCLETKLEFGSMIFPDKDEFNISAPQMVRIDSGGEVDHFLSVHEYKDMIKRHRIEEKERKRKYAEWEKANADKDDPFNPHDSWRSFRDRGDWYPFTPDSIYYDEAKAEIESRIRYYNRIALILQGLFDRSEILNPHPKAKLWEGDNFKEMVELVYDGGMVLHAGDKPDFGAYWRRCNKSLGKGSVTVGQDDYWQMLEAEKYCNQVERSYHGRRGGYRPQRYSPYGNKGPGFTARIAKWSKKKRQATYQWGREIQRRRRNWWRSEDGPHIQAKVTVPAEKLFNVSAYRKGDYKQFFNDPRTRAEYIQWAGYLLTSEEYLAGNEEVQEPEDVVAGHIDKWRKPHGEPKKKARGRGGR